MIPPLPQGFRVAGVHCGVKRNPQKEDLTLVVAGAPAVAAGVYTQNLICAAPVVLDRQRTPSARIRAVVTNSGNANACTGSRGDEDCRRMADLAAEVAGAEPDQSLVMSTGIIGEHLPMDRVEAGIRQATERLGTDEVSLEAAARGLMTTDTVPKISGRSLEVSSGNVQVTGIAKGSGMIGPNMATMLAMVMTDAALVPEDAQSLLSEAVDDTFNCISVDGHRSTNDTVLLLASGAAFATSLDAAGRQKLAEAIREVCEELAKKIVRDGEGATHLVEIEVRGARSKADARQIAATIANSPLVKTAVAGADPNWGRIVSAAGYAGVAFDPTSISLSVAGTPLYDNGQPVPFEAGAVSRAIRGSDEVKIELALAEGEASARFWTCDLTVQYVHINADYHT